MALMHEQAHGAAKPAENLLPAPGKDGIAPPSGIKGKANEALVDLLGIWQGYAERNAEVLFPSKMRETPLKTMSETGVQYISVCVRTHGCDCRGRTGPSDSILRSVYDARASWPAVTALAVAWQGEALHAHLGTSRLVS